jgi:hypothetical protein
LVFANAASATIVTYNATIVIDWYNGYVGQRTTTENNATVTVDYTGIGAFEITALTFSESVTGIGTMNLGETGTSTGTISGGVATGTVGYAGTVGSYSLLNVGGPYSGAVSSGLAFSPGDVYALQAYNAGTLTPPVAGNPAWGNWDHRPDAPTRIIFGVPEPATMGLLLLGLPLLRRRRA